MFVGNLPETTATADLRQLFGAYGVVARVHLLQEQDSNQEPGMGFVERSAQFIAVCRRYNCDT